MASFEILVIMTFRPNPKLDKLLRTNSEDRTIHHLKFDKTLVRTTTK